MAITKYGDINQRTAAYAAAEALSHIQPVIVLPRYATAKQIPRNTANQVKFRRAVPFIISTIPVVEGVTPASQKILYAAVILNQSWMARLEVGATDIGAPQ